MTISLKHTFQSANPDGPDATQVQPSNWNQEHVLTCSTARMLGRTTAGTGVVEELSVGTGLSLSAGTLAVGTVAVPNGGTGLTTLTANNVLLGNGTSAVQTVAPGTSGNVLTSNGTTWASSASPRDAWVQISSAAFVAGGTTFSSIPTTYSDLLVVLYDVVNTSGGTSAIWAYLGTSTTFQTTPIKLITAYSDGNYAYSTVLLPNYKADRGGIFINSGIESSALASPATATGGVTVDDAGTWRVTGGINRIKVSTDGLSSSGGTVVLYGK